MKSVAASYNECNLSTLHFIPCSCQFPCWCGIIYRLLYQMLLVWVQYWRTQYGYHYRLVSGLNISHYWL